MKSLIALVLFSFLTVSFAADAPKKDAKPAEATNCVKKDKNGKCPPPPKGEKPTPKKKSADAK